MSQLLARLQNQRASAVDPLERAELTARIAANFARLGKFDESKTLIAELRSVYGDGRSGRITVWIMLAEGLIYLYQDISPLALDKITRAQVLGLAMGYSTVVALASAWKAHIEFEGSNFEAMTSSLTIAQANVSADEHDAHTRIAMVISNSFMLCGDERASYRWFMTGREHALKNGDQASVEALLYNRATMALGWLRVSCCSIKTDAQRFQSIKSEVKSARNLQQITGIPTMENHVGLMEARLLTIDEKYEDAIAKLQDVRSKAPFAIHNFSQSLVDLEICFCYVRIGQIERAATIFETIDHSNFGSLDTDEKIVVLWMCIQLCEHDARFGVLANYLPQFEQLQFEHGNSCAILKKRLIPFDQQ